MHSEVEKLVERIAHLRGQIVDATGPLRPVDRLRLYADEPGDWEFSPDDAETVVELLDNLGHATREAASLIERLYRERETALNMRDQLAKTLRQTCGLACGLVVEFGNLNGFPNLSDEELGSAVMGVAREGARVLNLYDAALAEQPQ